LLLLLPTTTYRTEAFITAARTLGVDLVCASERPNVFEADAPEHLLTLDFADPGGAATTIADFHAAHPIRAVVGVDDATTVVAAAIAARLGLAATSVAGASAACDKLEMRRP
jgi:ATP-grasp N-terminal domain